MGAPTDRPSFVRAALGTLSANVGVAVLSFGNVLITARALGATGRGEVAFLTTIAFLTSQFATLGVEQYNANVAARRPDASPTIASTSLVMAALAGGLAGTLVAVLVVAFPDVAADAESALIALVVAAVPMLVLQVYLMYVVRAHYGSTVANVAWMLTPVTNVAVNGGLALAGELTVGFAVGSWVVGQLLTTLVMAVAIARRFGGFGRPSVRVAREMLGFGIKAHFGRVMLLGNYRLDQWILGAVVGARDLGLYSVAVAWSEILFFLPTAIQLVQRPDLAKAEAEDAGRQAAVSYRATALITVAAAVAMIVLAPFLCTTLFGESFRGSVEMLRILVLGSLGVATLKLLGTALTAQGRPLLETAGVGVAFAATVALDVILIPSEGGTGAAIASTAAYTAGGVVMALIFVRTLNVRPRDLLPTGAELLWLWRRLRGRGGPDRGPTAPTTGNRGRSR
jgi:O-antigen/teichoic acid export membrane protein